MDRRRRASTGKSGYLDSAISIIEDFQNSKDDLTHIVSKCLDRVLFNEIRSVAWRVFLNILPSKCSNEWVNLTKKNRANFEQELSTKVNNLCKYIDAEICPEEAHKVLKKDNNLDEFELVQLLRSVVKEEAKKSNIYNSLSESAQKIFSLWLINNPNKVKPEHYTKCFRVLLTLMFALYPCMINSSAEDCEISDDNSLPSAKELLYFLCCEDYFDHDIYSIYSEIMNRLLNLITSDSTSSDVAELYKRIASCEGNSKKMAEVLASAGRPEVDFLFYLGISNGQLLKSLMENNRNLSGLIHSITSTLFYDYDYGALIYFWDCILSCENDNQFNFTLINKHHKGFQLIDFLACSLISKVNPNILLEGDLTKVLPAYLYENVTESDHKLIVLASLKLREKIVNLFE